MAEISYFPNAPKRIKPVTASPEEGVRLIKAFARIEDSRARAHIVALAEEIAALEAIAKPSTRSWSSQKDATGSDADGIAKTDHDPPHARDPVRRAPPRDISRIS